MASTLNKVLIYEKIAIQLNSAGIHYAVMHGLDDYPASIGRDLDVLIEKNEIHQSIEIISNLLRNLGFAVVVPPNAWGANWVFAFKGKLSIEVDLITLMGWGPILFVDQPNPTTVVGPFKVDLWASFVKRVLINVFAGNLPKGKWISEQDRELVEENLNRIIDQKLTKEFINVLVAKDAASLKRFAAKMRKNAILRSLLVHPISSIKMAYNWLGHEIPQYFIKCAPIVALVGPDGCGKSTTIQELKGLLPEIFTGLENRHWRPGLLPRLGSLAGKPAPTADEKGLILPNREPGKFHWFRLIYYLVDFFVGYFLKDLPASNGLKVVLYDRCALDMSIDPLRYGLSSKKGTKLLWRLSPKPDLIILLYDNPDQIFARKPELPKTEIEHQFQEWLNIAKEGHIHAIVLTNSTSTDVARQINDLLVKKFLSNSNYDEAHHNWRDSLEWLSLVIGNGPDLYKENPGKSRKVHPSALSHVLITHPDGRGFLIPLKQKHGVDNSLSLLNPQKKTSKLYKDFLSITLKAGIRPKAFPKINLLEDIDTPSPLNYIKKSLNCESLSFSISLGTPGVQRKPVIQVQNQNGEVVGYAKIGWNLLTKDLVKNEFEVLKKLETHSFRFIKFPRVIHYGEFDKKNILLTEPVEFKSKNSKPFNFSSLHSQCLEEIAQFEVVNLDFNESFYWHEIKNKLSLLISRIPLYQAKTLSQAITLLEHRLDGVTFPWYWKLGDFTPWNVSEELSGQKLNVIDLEYASPHSLPGWDIFHFLHVNGKPFEENLRDSNIQQFFKSIGIGDEKIHPLYLAYLVDLYTLRANMWYQPGQQLSRSGYAVFSRMACLISYTCIRLK